MTPNSAPQRQIVHADAMVYLAARGPFEGASIVTSLPDVSEVPERGFEGWRDFFMDAARLVASRVAKGAVGIFFQSDIKHQGRWIDKGYWVQRALEDSGLDLLWHKILCRKPAGQTTFGRSSYSHMLCFGRDVFCDVAKSTPDVLPAPGHMPWSRAMGGAACVAACRFIKRETETRTVVDPFCGHGTVLAVANALGMDAMGIELSARKCKKARGLVLDVHGNPVAKPEQEPHGSRDAKGDS